MMKTTGMQQITSSLCLHSFKFFLFFRCDNSGSEVNLEKCLHEYAETTIGCHFTNNTDSVDDKIPDCNATDQSKYLNFLRTYSTIIEGGEAEIHKITKCLPRSGLDNYYSLVVVYLNLHLHFQMPKK